MNPKNENSDEKVYTKIESDRGNRFSGKFDFDVYKFIFRKSWP